jgi:hypothetical protein
MRTGDFDTPTEVVTQRLAIRRARAVAVNQRLTLTNDGYGSSLVNIAAATEPTLRGAGRMNRDRSDQGLSAFRVNKYPSRAPHPPFKRPLW